MLLPGGVLGRSVPTGSTLIGAVLSGGELSGPGAALEDVFSEAAPVAEPTSAGDGVLGGSWFGKASPGEISTTGSDAGGARCTSPGAGVPGVGVRPSSLRSTPGGSSSSRTVIAGILLGRRVLDLDCEPALEPVADALGLLAAVPFLGAARVSF